MDNFDNAAKSRLSKQKGAYDTALTVFSEKPKNWKSKTAMTRYKNALQI